MVLAALASWILAATPFSPAKAKEKAARARKASRFRVDLRYLLAQADHLGGLLRHAPHRDAHQPGVHRLNSRRSRCVGSPLDDLGGGFLLSPFFVTLLCLLRMGVLALAAGHVAGHGGVFHVLALLVIGHRSRGRGHGTVLPCKPSVVSSDCGCDRSKGQKGNEVAGEFHGFSFCECGHFGGSSKGCRRRGFVPCEISFEDPVVSKPLPRRQDDVN